MLASRWPRPTRSRSLGRLGGPRRRVHGQIVANDQAQGLHALGHQLVHLQLDHAAVVAQLNQIAPDLVGDPADHLARLQDAQDVSA